MGVFEFRRERIGANAGPLQEIPVGDIVPSPYQPRLHFEEEGIKELAASIAQIGLLQPLVVRRVGERTFELIAGERRLRAVKRLGMERVCCIVREALYEERLALMALVENIQREDLHYLEEAKCMSLLLQSFDYTQEELAKKLGKSQSAVANKLRLLKLPQSIQEALVEEGLTERHARALLKLPEEGLQREALEQIAERRLSVQAAERLTESLLAGKGKTKKPDPKVIRLIKDYRLFMNSINAAVEQLRAARFHVEVFQEDLKDGVDIALKVRRAPALPDSASRNDGIPGVRQEHSEKILF